MSGAKHPVHHHQSYDVECGVLSLHFIGSGSIVLLDGQATVFGAPLVRNVRYPFHKCGAPIEVTGKARLDVEGDFTASQCLLDSAVDELHALLDTARADAAIRIAQREAAAAAAAATATQGAGASPSSDEVTLLGPRVIIVGDQNTGKTSLCRTLANLATRTREYGVAYVDVDVGQQSITVPGSIATAFLEAPIPVDDGLHNVMPLSFFFGDKIVTAATRKRYLDLCSCSAQAVASVGFAKPHFEAGGILVNTMGWTTDLGKDLLTELLSIFAATHVVVTSADSELASTMENAALGRSVKVLRYPKQTMLMKRGASVLAGTRTQQLVSYYTGTLRTPLSPARGMARVQDVVFLNALTLTPMSWQDIKPNCVAAVSWADTEQTAAEANVAGYIVLLEVGKRYFSFLAPAAGELPKPFLLVSSTLFMPNSKIPPLSAN